MKTIEIMERAELGTFKVTVRIFGPEGDESPEMAAVVALGSTYTAVPRDILESLGVVPLERATFELADGSIAEYEIADVRIRLGDSVRTVPVTFGPEATDTLLGATALEIFRLVADPVRRELVPVHLPLKLLGNAGLTPPW